MKTKFLRIGKSSVAMVLSFLMVLSTVLVGSVGTLDATAADVAVQSSGDTSTDSPKTTLPAKSNTTMLVAAFTDRSDIYFNDVYVHMWDDNGDISDYPKMTSANFDGVKFYKPIESKISGNGHIKYALCTANSWTNAWSRENDAGFTKYTQWVAWRTSSSGSGDFETFNPIEITNVTDPGEITEGETAAITVTVDGGFPWFYYTKFSNDGKAYYLTIKDNSGDVLLRNQSVKYGTNNHKYTYDWTPSTTNNTLTFTVSDSDGIDYVSYQKTFTVNSAKTVGLGTLSTKTVDESGNTVDNVEGNTYTATKSGSTITVTPTTAANYTVHEVSYSYTKEDGTAGSGVATTVSADGKYTFTVPSDIKDNTNIDITVTFGPLRKFTVTAYVDDTNKSSSYEDGKYYVEIIYNGQTTKSTGAGLISVENITEGDEVTLNIHDDKDTDDYIIDKWSLTNSYTLSSGNLNASRQSGSTSLANHSITIVPKGNVDATAYFKDDPGEPYSAGGNDYHVVFSDTAGAEHPTNMNQAAKVMKTYSGIYYVSIPKSKYSFTNGANYHFCLSSSKSYSNMYYNTGDPHVEVDPNVSAYVTGRAKNGGYTWSDGTGYTYYYAQFSFNNASVESIKIILNDPNSTNNDWKGLNAKYYKISAELSNMSTPGNVDGGVMVIAKDGTIRGAYTKFARMADTTIQSATIDGVEYTRNTNLQLAKDGTTYSINASSFDNLSETVTLPKGTTINFQTEIDSANRGTYYVKAFNINGETYFPNETTIPANGIYTCSYTIPENTTNNYIEITPVYFYQDTNNTVRFYVENFDSNVQAEWGTPYQDSNTSNYNTDAILSCYAWYTTNQGGDLVSATDKNKPALGGYPGQPMVYENGHYVMEVPKYVNNAPVLGITLNNYVWDYVHGYTFGADTDAKKETVNCQTYDYDDFIELAKVTDDIIFRFKYRTAEAQNHWSRYEGNKPGDSKIPTSLKNGFEVYTDYYGNVIDLRNNIIDNGTKDYPTVDSVQSANKYYQIVSDGYRDMYLGHFAVIWYVYDQDGKYVTKLPSSAFFYEIYKSDADGNITTTPKDDITVNADGKITSTNVPASFISALNNTTRRGTWSNDALTVDDYWKNFVKLYNQSEGIPAIITYETAIRATDINSGSHPRDPALRCDGRWYYSKANALIKANIVIEYKRDADDPDTAYIEDSYNVADGTDLSTVTNPKGKVTGATPKFTNTDGDFENKVVAKDVLANSSNTFDFEVPGTTSDGVGVDEDGNPTNESKTYVFVGWYIKKDGVYSPINQTELDKLTGKTERTGETTLVARYVPYSGDVITIKHDLYKDDNEAFKFSESPDAHNGDGTPTVSEHVYVVYTESGSEKKVELPLVGKSSNSVTIDKTVLSKYLDTDKYPDAKIVVTLEVETKGNTTTDGVDSVTLADLYRKTNDETTDEPKNEDDDSTKNTTVGYVSFKTDNTTATTDAYDVSTWHSNTAANDATAQGIDGSEEKKYSVEYNCVVSDLFKEDGTLKTNIVRFFADLRAPINANIIIEYKKNATDTEYTVDSYVDSNNKDLIDDELSTTSNPQGKVTGATPKFTNSDTSYENKVVAKNVPDDDSEETFNFAVPETTSNGHVADENGEPTEQEQTYVFEGWYLKDGDTYTPINPDDIDQLTGETQIKKNVTLVARYVPLGDTITIQHDLYKDNDKAQKFSNSPAAHSGDGTPTVNKVVKVEYTDSNGKHEETISLVNSSDNSVTIDKAALSKYLDTTKYQNAKIYVTLEVETSGNTDSNPVVLADLYRKTNDETGSEKDLNNKIGYVSFKDDTSNDDENEDAYGVSKWNSGSDTASETTGSGSEKKYSVVYNCEISDLFKTNDEGEKVLKTSIVRFFADLSLSSINVVFKYYDRNDDTNKSQPETVDVYPTTLTVYGVKLDSKGLEQTIANAYTQPGVKLNADGSETSQIAINDISSVIDTYEFWASQAQAVQNFGEETNHHAERVNGEEQKYKATIQDDDKDSENGNGNLAYHADCYGYAHGESEYLNDFKNDSHYTSATDSEKTASLNEKWVTYIGFNDKEIAEDKASADPSSVKKVIVWGFNTPKDYNIDFYVPSSATPTPTSDTIVEFVKETSEEDGLLINHIVGFRTNTLEPFKGKYNERVGDTYEDLSGINDLSPYLRKVYGIAEDASLDSKLTINDDTTPRNPGTNKVTLDGRTYVFDGWYNADNVKVSSDYTYANRITSDLYLTAGYRLEASEANKGLTLSKNQVERYINENGVERIRYTTQVNTYGCNDSDYNIKDIAIIYIKPVTGKSLSDSDIKAILESTNIKNSVTSALTTNRATEDPAKAKPTVNTFTSTGNYNGIIYAYDVVITTNDGSLYDAGSLTSEPTEDTKTATVTGNDVVLTNKNRAQFTLDLKADSVKPNESNYDIIVYAAFNYAGTTIISDNYLEYKDEPISKK